MPDSFRVELTFPPSELSPNRARNVHWSVKSASTRAYRFEAMLRTRQIWTVNDRLPEGEIPLTVTFHPPDNRKRDRTNMEAAFKAGFDGIADALGVDDNRFVPTYRKGGVVKGGLVVVEIGV